MSESLQSIWWVRHGPTHQKSFCGWRDVPADLSDTDAVARLAAGLPADAVVVSSDLDRAVRTADAICGARERVPHVRGLREFDFGLWDGMTFSDVADTYPELSRAFWEKPGRVAPPQGESWNDLDQRVNAAISELMKTHPDRDLIIVAHIGVILTQVARARGQIPYQALAQDIRPLSASKITYSNARLSAGAINHIF